MSVGGPAAKAFFSLMDPQSRSEKYLKGRPPRQGDIQCLVSSLKAIKNLIYKAEHIHSDFSHNINGRFYTKDASFVLRLVSSVKMGKKRLNT